MKYRGITRNKAEEQYYLTRAVSELLQEKDFYQRCIYTQLTTINPSEVSQMSNMALFYYPSQTLNNSGFEQCELCEFNSSTGSCILSTSNLENIFR